MAIMHESSITEMIDAVPRASAHCFSIYKSQLDKEEERRSQTVNCRRDVELKEKKIKMIVKSKQDEIDCDGVPIFRTLEFSWFPSLSCTQSFNLRFQELFDS